MRAITAIASITLLAGGCAQPPAGATPLPPQPTSINAVASASGALRQPSPKEAKAATVAGPLTDSEAPPATDLAFHYGRNGNLGWSPRSEPLFYALNAPESTVQLIAGLAMAGPQQTAASRAMLPQIDWNTTPVELTENELCRPALRAAIDQRKPTRLLLSMSKGLTSRGVACLRNLKTERLYIGGCHRGENCNGDEEIEALAADEVIRRNLASTWTHKIGAAYLTSDLAPPTAVDQSFSRTRRWKRNIVLRSSRV